LEDVTVDQVMIVNDYKKKQHLFSIQTPKRTFYLQAESDNERTRWIEAIKQEIKGKDVFNFNALLKNSLLLLVEESRA
jgi:hypothetical protein